MATLKISDISVGDWVQNNYGDYVKVEGIWQGSNFNYQVDTLRDGRIGTIIPCNLHPIPITAEILEQNGFVKKNYDNGKMWDWWCDNVLVRKFADEDIYRFIVAFSSMHYTTTMVVGKHTHQLQHALRLAGVDKEINLL